MKDKTVWILTCKFNEYYQFGEYFLAFFFEKPTFQDLKKVVPDETDETIGKLTRNEQNGIHFKYFLREVEAGLIQKDYEIE